jgi:lipopolysaccharide cholinephosphotransferase
MIDPKLQEQFRAEFNPDGSMLRRQQMKMLDILLHVDKICKQHNISYWLSSGTLLGAVRHGGFIPWDDDVDIEMMREDYLRFEKIFEENDNYVLQTYKNDLCYMMPYAKVRDKFTVLTESYNGEEYKYRGVFVDIFPMEHTHKCMSYISYAPIWFMRKYIVRLRNNLIGRVVIKVLKACSFGFISVLRALMKLVPGKRLCYAYGTWCFREDHSVEDLYPLSLTTFENYELPIPGNSDAYLRRLYGEYMSIPAVKVAHGKDIKFFK